MNSTEQKQRHTAVTELRDEVATMIDALLKSVGQQLEQEHQAWTKALSEAISYDRHSDATSCQGCRHLRKSVDDVIGAHAKALQEHGRDLRTLTDVIDRTQPMLPVTVWGRLRWLVIGR